MNLQQAFLRFLSIKRCASDLPVSHMDSFFSSQGRWETSSRVETRIIRLEGTRRLLMWLCARCALALELFVNCYSPSSVALRCGSARDAEQIVATRCLCRYRVIPAVKVLWSFQSSNSLGRLVNNIGTAECFGVVLFVVRQQRDQGRPAGTCIHPAWCGMPVPNGPREEVAIRCFSPSPSNLLLTLGN